jgi:dipeptidyl aminopeptidase/acylaminoacyl peptidase
MGRSGACRRAFAVFFNLLCWIIVYAAAPNAAASEPFAVEELLAIPAVHDIVSSPDGAIAWVEQANGVRNIYVAGPPAYAARRVTDYRQDDGANITLVGFVPGATHLVFKRGTTGFNPANLPDPPQEMLHVLSLQDGSIRRLDDGDDAALGTPVVAPDGAELLATKGGEVWSYSLKSARAPQRLFTTRGDITELLFSPDGTRLAFVSDRSRYQRGDYAFVGVFDRKARSVTYMAPGVGVDQNPIWSPDGRRLGFIRVGFEPRTWRFSRQREGAPFSVIVADAASGEGGAVWTAPIGYGSQFNGFDASGYTGLGGTNNLLWLADDTLVFPYERTGWKLLYAVTATGGEARLLTPGVFEIDGVALSPDRSTIVYWANSEADPHRLDLYSMSLRNSLQPRRLAGSAEGGMRHDAQFTAANALLYRHAGPFVPERLVLYADAGRAQQISTGPRPGDPLTKKAVDAEVVTFKSLDGLPISAVLYRSKPRPGQTRQPAIVHAHGGSRSKVYPTWRTGFSYAQVLHYLASRGYVVLSVNYRSGTGYGLDFREPESYGGRGAGDVQDFIAAAQFLKEHVPQVDPAKIAIYGHSYGGHIVSNALARSDVFAAGVDSAGVGDWVVELEKDFGKSLQFNIPQRYELEQLAHASSAISIIDEWGEEPILFLNGDHDGSAAMQPMLELYLALQRRGKTVDALVMPGEAHSLQLYRNQVAYLRKIEQFLREHVGP